MSLSNHALAPRLAGLLLAAFAACGSLTSPPAWAEPDAAKAAPGSPASHPPEKIITIQGITEYRLANGLQVLLGPDDSKPTITMNMVYRVGSRHEGPGEAGMAHLLEHMLFKG